MPGDLRVGPPLFAGSIPGLLQQNTTGIISLTGKAANNVTITAGSGNQNVALVPSGTGSIWIGTIGTSHGILNLPSSTSSTAGIAWGADCSLYRNASGNLIFSSAGALLSFNSGGGSPNIAGASGGQSLTFNTSGNFTFAVPTLGTALTIATTTGVATFAAAVDLGANTTSAHAIQWSSDTQLFRTSAGFLQTSALGIGGANNSNPLFINSNGGTGVAAINATNSVDCNVQMGNTTSGAGTKFGFLWTQTNTALRIGTNSLVAITVDISQNTAHAGTVSGVSYSATGGAGVATYAFTAGNQIYLKNANQVVIGAGSVDIISFSGVAATMGGSTSLITAASVASRTGFNMPAGTAPTSPVDGDFWYDGTNVKFRVGGTTKTFTLI